MPDAVNQSELAQTLSATISSVPSPSLGLFQQAEDHRCEAPKGQNSRHACLSTLYTIYTQRTW